MHLHLESPNETLFAVVVGAVLATAGGFVASQLESHMRRREREHSAALLFGEIFSALQTIIAIAEQSRLRGEAYGPVTLRLLGAAQREAQTYERNRTALYDLHDAEIRIRIHVLMVRITLALESVVDATAAINAVEDKPDRPDAAAGAARRDALLAARELAFSYTLETAAEIRAIVATLQPLARVDFEALKRHSGNPFDPVSAQGVVDTGPIP